MGRSSCGVRWGLILVTWVATGSTGEARCPETKLLPDDVLWGDRFSSVAVDGDVAVCGSWNKHHPPHTGPGEEWAGRGGAYVFLHEDGDWRQAAILEPSDSGYDDEFALSVAIEGDVVVAASAQNGVGVAYVFEKPPTGWKGVIQESAQLTPALPTTASAFGIDLDIDGDVVAVSALNDSHAGSSSGRVYVFEKHGERWGSMTETARLQASDAAAGDRFGVDLALANEMLVVGADQAARGGTGTVYVFHRPAAGWADATEDAVLHPEGLDANAAFGYSIAIAETAVVVGSIEFSSGGAGSAYVFELPSAHRWTGTIRPSARLVGSDSEPGALFGVTVAARGSSVFVGAVFEDNENGENAGAVYLFRPGEEGWSSTTEHLKITPADGAPDDRFGKGLAANASSLLVGASDHDATGENTGAIYDFAWFDALYRVEPTDDSSVHLVVETSSPLRGGECALRVDRAVARVVSVEPGPDLPAGVGLLRSESAPATTACAGGAELEGVVVRWAAARTSGATLPPGVHRIATLRLARSPSALPGDTGPVRLGACPGEDGVPLTVVDATGVSRCTLLEEGAVSASDLATEPRFVRGDADGDGVVSDIDAVRILGYLFTGGEAPGCLDSADANDAGGIDIADPIYILNWRFRGGAPPPAPYPDCALDTTPDALACERYARCER